MTDLPARPAPPEHRPPEPPAPRPAEFVRRPPRPVARLLEVGLYPLETRLIIIGLVAAAMTLALLDWASAVAVLGLFALVGISWRGDMVPVVPACLAYQWVFITTAYVYDLIYGYLPGRAFSDALQPALMLSLAGLLAIAIGFRIVLYLARKSIFKKTLAPAASYNIRRLFLLTIGAFAISYVVDVLPKAIWFGGAQIIENVLALRFVPYFVLLVAAFERRRDYRYLGLATAFVIGPQLLTGFSDFKEILFVILIAMLARWRPWNRSREQAAENWRILLFALLGATALLAIAIAWNGGIKREWRDRIWTGVISDSPIERMGKFFKVSGEVITRLNVADASGSLVERLTSSEIYFARVLERVPTTISHENGELLRMAIANAVTPRFLFPEKADLGGDSWMVRKYAGMSVAGDESSASIGLGYMVEFFIDFGLVGVLGLCLAWGMIGAGGMAALSRVAPSRELFLALIIALLTQYFMAFEGSFIKLFAGFMQRTIISYAVFAVVGPPMHKWLRPVRSLR